MKSVDFFMGANSPDGFYSFYEELRIPRIYVRSYLIKGGAGTGKSGLMKKIAERFAACDELIEEIHCSSDPSSLDGVILHTARCSIVDATSPHVIEPSYPGSYETVINLCDYFDEDELEPRLLKTVELQKKNNDCHQKCRNLIRCAAILLQDNAYLVEEQTDFEKINRTAEKICAVEFSDKRTASAKNEAPTEQPRIKKRLLSAVTNQGIHIYENTVRQLCDRVIAVRDDYGVAAGAFMQIVLQNVQKRGYSAFCCYCPLSPANKIEHILLPDLGLAFITESPFHPMKTVKPDKTLHFTRFTDMEKLKPHKHFLRFNKRAADELLDCSICVLKEAKQIHDELEAQYTPAMDFSAVNKKTAQILKKIEERY